MEKVVGGNKKKQSFKLVNRILKNFARNTSKTIRTISYFDQDLVGSHKF